MTTHATGWRDAPSGELEDWIADLAGGETSLRRLRKRQEALLEESGEAIVRWGRPAADHPGTARPDTARPGADADVVDPVRRIA